MSFLSNDPTLKLQKSASSLLLGRFFLRFFSTFVQYFLNSATDVITSTTLQLDFFHRILVKYRERHDRSLEEFIQNQCLANEQVNSDRLFTDLSYGYACFLHEFFRLADAPEQAEVAFLSATNRSHSGKNNNYAATETSLVNESSTKPPLRVNSSSKSANAHRQP